MRRGEEEDVRRGEKENGKGKPSEGERWKGKRGG
jgi:hypothetical protein